MLDADSKSRLQLGNWERDLDGEAQEALEELLRLPRRGEHLTLPVLAPAKVDPQPEHASELCKHLALPDPTREGTQDPKHASELCKHLHFARPAPTRQRIRRVSETRCCQISLAPP